MENIIPKSIPDLLARSQAAARGAAAVGPAIGLVLNTSVAITTNYDNLTLKRDLFDAGVKTLSNNRAVVRSLTATSRDFLRVTRDVLKKRLGARYSVAWNNTGFVGGFELPTTADAVLVHLERVHTFLTANPDYQVEVLEVTAARADSLRTSLNTAMGSVETQEATNKGLLKARHDAEKAMRVRLRGLINELKQLIGLLDRRWLAFGLNIPGLEQTPVTPENVVVVSHVTGQIDMNWPKVPRAASFHVWERVMGPDGEQFNLIGSPTDRQFTKSGLTSGTRLELCVSALNTGGESGKSAIVVVNVA